MLSSCVLKLRLSVPRLLHLAHYPTYLIFSNHLTFCGLFGLENQLKAATMFLAVWHSNKLLF